MDPNPATPDEFDSIVELPTSRAQPRRVLFTRRRVRLYVIGGLLVTVAPIALLFGLSVLMFLPYELAHTKRVSDYPRLLTRFRTLYRGHMDLFPPSIPAGVMETEFDANPESMMQGLPYMRLGMQLGPADAAAERARL